MAGFFHERQSLLPECKCFFSSAEFKLKDFAHYNDRVPPVVRSIGCRHIERLSIEGEESKPARKKAMELRPFGRRISLWCYKKRTFGEMK